jgi:uncharacterized protein YkwD
LLEPKMSCLTRLPALLLALAVAACAGSTAERGGPRIRGDVAAVRLDPAAASGMVSAYRTAKGLPAVRLDPSLNRMAQIQADAMARQGVLSHDAGGPFGRRLREAGVETSSAAENIAAGYFSLDATMDSWKRSPSHNKNLLMPRATRFGIALAKAPGTRYQTYWAMVVASDPAPPPEVATLSAGPVVVRRTVRRAEGEGGSFASALTAPFSGLFGN